ncbi:MAG: UvrD-helicase domain-containing protein, partial [Terriglobales bacterium]
ICKRLIDDYALESGLPPGSGIITEERMRMLFATAAEPAIEMFSDTIEGAAHRLGWYFWRNDVLKICEIARGNDMHPEQLDQFAQRSWDGLSALLEPEDRLGSEMHLDIALKNAVFEAIPKLEALDDESAITDDALETLRNARRDLRDGAAQLRWQAWAKLAKIHAAKSADALLKKVRAAAAGHALHPRLRSDLQTAVTVLFQCAREAMVLYADFKRRHALVDFSDLEFFALKLLEDEAIASDVQRSLTLTLVDEFQDTSPIQLSLFLRLAGITARSIWVGDEKQAIYGFRGSDPRLIRNVVHALPGHERDQLDTSYRSRPQLVQFANALFGRAFAAQGLTNDQVQIKHIHRGELDGQSVALQT